MNKNEIVNTLIGLIHKVTDIPEEEISAESALMDDLDMSSLEVMTSIAALEKMFKLKIPMKQMRKFVTVGDVADYLHSIQAK